MEEMINGRMAVNAYDCPSHEKDRPQAVSRPMVFHRIRHVPRGQSVARLRRKLDSPLLPDIRQDLHYGFGPQQPFRPPFL